MVLTKKQELFTLNLFKGMTQRESWIDAGYSSNYPLVNIDSNACRLANQTKIKARLAELNKSIQGPDIATVEERQKVLTEIIRGRLGHFINVDGEVIEVNKDNLQHASLQELKTVVFTGGKDGRATEKTTTVKLHNPISAIDLLNKMDNTYKMPPTYQDNRVVNIIVSSEKAKELIEGVGQFEIFNR